MRLSRQIDETLGEMAEAAGATTFDILEWFDAARWRRIAFAGIFILLLAALALHWWTFCAAQELRLAYDLAQLGAPGCSTD